MRANEGHEDYTREEKLEGSSNRQFGLVFTGAFSVIAAWPLLSGRPFRWWSLIVAASFLGVTLVAPGVLTPFNRAWLRFGLLLNRCVSPIVLAVLFFTTVTPIGLLMRALGKDPLRLRLDREAPTYWIERRPPGPDGETMSRQF
jgi:Saxitoxin biosynthesis operon protein SxtJ